MSWLLLFCVQVCLCSTLKSRKLMVWRFFDFLRNLYEQRNESGLLDTLVRAVEMLENKHRLHKCTQRKAFIALHIVTDTGIINAAGTHLQTYGRVLPQTEQMLYPNMSISDFFTEIWKELICGTWRWGVQRPIFESFSSIVKRNLLYQNFRFKVLLNLERYL